MQPSGSLLRGLGVDETCVWGALPRMWPRRPCVRELTTALESPDTLSLTFGLTERSGLTPGTWQALTPPAFSCTWQRPPRCARPPTLGVGETNTSGFFVYGDLRGLEGPSCQRMASASSVFTVSWGPTRTRPWSGTGAYSPPYG